MLSKKNRDVEVVILTSHSCNITKLDIHHCGASLKDLGKKCFAISKIEDMAYVEKISNIN